MDNVRQQLYCGTGKENALRAFFLEVVCDEEREGTRICDISDICQKLLRRL